MVFELLDWPLRDDDTVQARWDQLVLGACRVDENFHSRWDLFPVCEGTAGECGLRRDFRGPWVLGGDQNLHGISTSLLVSCFYHSHGGPWCTCILTWMLWGSDPFGWNIFPLVLEILTWARWDRAPGIPRSSGAVMIYVCFFYWAEVLLLFAEMTLGCVDDFWEILADESWC